MFGNVWEWLEDHFNGLPGFETHWLYDDFSAPCFDGRHKMIMVRNTTFYYHIDKKRTVLTDSNVDTDRGARQTGQTQTKNMLQADRQTDRQTDVHACRRWADTDVDRQGHEIPRQTGR